MTSLAEIKLLISSILVANPLECLIKTFRKNYQQEIGEDIPFYKFGYSSLEEFLSSLTEIVRVDGFGDNAILKVVVNEKVAHLDKLIQNQKVCPKVKDQSLRRRTHDRTIYSPSSSFDRRNCANRVQNFDNFQNETFLKSSDDRHEVKYPHNVLRLDESIPRLQVSKIYYFPRKTQVNVGSVYNPSKFYIILNENFNALEEMMDDMQKVYAEEKHKLKIEKEHLKRGIYCVSVYNGEYHRGLVKKVMPENRQANVFFIDYGILDIVDFGEIYFLKKVFAKFPSQAIRAGLCDILPVISGTPWSIEARDGFIEMVNSKALNIEICHTDEKNQILGIYMFDNSNGQKRFVNKELVKQNLAQRDFSNSRDGICMYPSFEEIEEHVIEHPLPQNVIISQFENGKTDIVEALSETHDRKSKFVIEMQLFEQNIHVVCVNNKFYITIFEMIDLAKLRNTSVSLMWRKITKSKNASYTYSICSNNNPKLCQDLRYYGLKSANNESFCLVSVDFIPLFFQYFVDVIFPRALFETFLEELNATYGN